MNQLRLAITSENIITDMNGVAYKLYDESTGKRHQYSLPVERSNDYDRLLFETNARNPESMLEPEQGKILAADVDFEYNYYVPSYEALRVSTLKNYPHLLPSLNMFLAHERELMSPSQNSRYTSLFSINGRLSDSTFTDRLVLSKEYFTDFGVRAERVYGDSVPVSENNMVHEMVNKQIRELYADSENKRENFPFFGKINVEGFENSEIAGILESNQLDKRFVDFLIMHRDDMLLDASFTYDYDRLDGGLAGSISHPVRFYMLDTLYAHIDDGHTEDVVEYGEAADTTCSYFEKFLLGNLAKTKIQNYINSSEVGTSSPVAFRVEKLNAANTQIISVHYFFNYEDVTNFQLFDTQVHYDVVYNYRIKIINSVVAQVGDTAQKTLVFTEEHFYNDSIKILDSPPIPPDVELITYRGVSNKVLILLNQMIDQRAMVPVYINESDPDSFDRQYEAQKIQKPRPLIFESDDPTDFELFKTTEHPSEYSEFANSFYRVIRSGGMTAASYTDTIIPNQTYYYMFRALDVHGFPSNPSPIYEFTLIKEGETMYPRIRIVELAKPDPPSQKSKTFKKYMKISFAPEQIQLSDDVLANLDENALGMPIDIGTANDSVVGSNRRFKFRIKSKNTGKLIDINVTFKKNKLIRA